MIAESYPYLAATLFGLPQILFGLAVAGPQRRAMAASGVLFMPWSVGAPLFESYWSPARLGGLAVGIEDLLYCFQTGAATWFWCSMADRRRLTVDLRLGSVAVRALAAALPIAAAFAALDAAGVPGVIRSIVVTSAIVVVLLAAMPHFWRIALAASAGYTSSYVVFLWEVFAIWPHAMSMWPEAGPLSDRVLGIPVGEFAFAAIGAPAHALIVAFVTRASFVLPVRS